MGFSRLCPLVGISRGHGVCERELYGSMMRDKQRLKTTPWPMNFSLRVHHFWKSSKLVNSLSRHFLPTRATVRYLPPLNGRVNHSARIYISQNNHCRVGRIHRQVRKNLYASFFLINRQESLSGTGSARSCYWIIKIVSSIIILYYSKMKKKLIKSARQYIFSFKYYEYSFCILIICIL